MKTTPIAQLSLTTEQAAVLLQRGVTSTEQLSDLLHGSSASRESVAALLSLTPEATATLCAQVDQFVPIGTAKNKIGHLGARPPHSHP